jgi:septal ring factor EnvC (AmiA/AmiB activator)
LEITDVVAEVDEAPEANKTSSGGERLNWLNEDMQRQLMATAEVFMQPLVNRIEALTAADKEKDVLLRAKEEELEEARQQLKLLPDLESQRARLLREIEAERQAAEVQFAKAREREEEAKVLVEENERLKQKAEEAALSAAKLEELEKVVQDLRKPKPGFWQKFFGVQS